MERAQNMTIPPRIAIGIIILFHLVGLVGLSLAVTKELFLQIVPFHLLLMFGIIVLSHHKLNSSFGIFILLIFWLGFLAEWVGVHTGWLFGNYAYDSTLGLKLSSIPLMIGVNWFLLIYATGVAMQRSRLKSAFFRVIAGAGLLVLLDVLIEPIAIKFNYWHWNSPGIPLKNYVCWFFVSAVMLNIFELFRFKKQGIAAVILLLTEFVFFGVLNLVGAL
ncbi:carotenoid biosynthesis protein [Mucilaginibacter lutimaris]|uniref:Carotenoid biosynthesis protein n=1 Tax=Mucilaginibacter lutimaris TaxID=931629 RepID=A0ABW2ZIR9_9SPHI